MDSQEDGRPSEQLEAGRNSPASATCYLPLLDTDSLLANASAGDAPESQDDGATPAQAGSPVPPSDGSDNTPRSEVPSTAESPAVWHVHPSNSLFAPDPSGGEPCYFSPRPLRYHHTSLPRSNHTSANPSPTHSTNVSTASINVASLDPAYLPPTTAPISIAATTPDLSDRPLVHRDTSSSSTATTSTIRHGVVLYPLETSLRDYPQFPNQAYSALQTQTHPAPYIPHNLRTRSSHPSHYSSFSASQVATLANPLNHDRFETGSRTVGNSPSSSPSLFTPDTPSVKPADGEGSYSSPYLHYTHRQIPKETHVADVDFDPISGRKIINQYEVIDELGRGVHGKVKLGKNLETGQFVAIKIVDRFSKRRRLGKTNSYEDKIRREIAILKKARHPNIVSLLEVIDDPTVKKVYIVLEHVELGEVKWRTEGAKEIVLLEYRRSEREAKGVFDHDATADDELIFQAATKRRERKEKSRWREFQRRNRGSQHESWSFEHGGDSEDDDSEYANLSRVSTATAHQPYVEGGSAADGASKINRDVAAASPSHAHSGSRNDPVTGLEGTMYGAYATEVTRGRTPSITGSASSASLDIESIDFVPEHFRYVPLLPLSAVRAAIRDTILGLEYLHYQGVVHRDIKPANLLQTKDHRIKISDFGVSYLGRNSGSSDVAGDMSESDAPDVDEAVELAKTVGTPAFYAPELCRTDEDADPLEVTHAIDVWAVGVTLYCLVFGRVPFHDENTFVLMRKIAEEQVHIPRQRLKAVDDQGGSRPSSHGRYFHSTGPNRRAPHDLEYEDVDEELHDFLQRLLEKDPRRRLTLKAAKMHPWVLRDIANPELWYHETEPEKQTQGKKIELTKEDISAAVVPLTLRDKIVAGIRKIGGALVGRSASTRGRRDRARSSATPSEGLPSSAASSSSTISQDARRPSLRVDEQLFAALKNSRETEHPLSQSLSASTEGDTLRYMFGSRPGSPLVSVETLHSANSSHRSATTEPSHSTMSTATSVRTIRPSDLTRAPRPVTLSSPLQLTALPTTPVAMESPSNLGGIFGGASRKSPIAPRTRDGSAHMKPLHHRARSIDRLVCADDDPHAQPSIALSDTVAAGHVDLPDALRDGSPRHAFAMGPHSPQIYPYGHSDRLHPDSATNTPSRQSSISSVSSHMYEPRTMADDRPPTRGSGIQASLQRASSDERFTTRPRGEFSIRRHIYGDADYPKVSSSHSRPPSALSQSACPPSPDDEVYFHKRKDDGISGAFHPDAHSSSLETSPLGHPFNQKILTSSSSEDQFTSGLSQSTSNPSIPSVISANSSIAPDEAPLAEPYKEVIPRSSEDTLNPTAMQTLSYESYRNEQVAESADDEDDDSDGDFIEITTRQNRHSKSIGRSGSMSNTELNRRRHHRTSSRTTRSGSGGTVRKPRSHGASPDATPTVEPLSDQHE